MEPCQHLRALVRSRLFPLQLPKGLTLTPHLAPLRAKGTGDKRQGRITQSASVIQGQEHMSAVKCAIYSASIGRSATLQSNLLPFGVT